MSSFQGVLIRKVPAVLFIEVSSFQGVLIRGVPAVLFIEVSSFQGVLIRGVPAILFIEVSSFQGVLIRGVPLYLLLITPIHLPLIDPSFFFRPRLTTITTKMATPTTPVNKIINDIMTMTTTVSMELSPSVVEVSVGQLQNVLLGEVVLMALGRATGREEGRQ